MTIDAKTHGVIDDALRHRHLRQVPVAHRAIDARADVRGMIEADVRFFKKSIHPLPGHVLTALRMVSQGLDSGICRIADIFMTKHAKVDAWNSRTRARFHSRMAVLAVDCNVAGVDFVREVDRLLRLGSDIQEMSGGIAKSSVRRRECRRAPSLRCVGIYSAAGVTRYVGLLHATGHHRINSYEQRHPTDAPIANSSIDLHCPRKIAARS